MLADWFGRPARRPRREPQGRSARPYLETLEDRNTPTAIRAVPGFTGNSLGPNDDGSALANIGFNINFLGTQTDQVNVNNNGNISLGAPFSVISSTALTGNNGGIPIIAPFFADVDTTGAGSGVVTFGTDSLSGFPAFGVDYINVGYFNGHVDKLNSFQVILVSRPDTGAGNFDIEFNYDTIQWETGDNEGGTAGLGGQSAQVGFTDGTGNPANSFLLPGSGVPGSFLDGGPEALASNSQLATTPGRYHFLVRNGQVIQSASAGMFSNLDVTSGTKLFFPFRYITDPGTDVQEGNLTLVNLFPLLPSATNATANAALDITTGTSAPPPSLNGPTFPGPITVVFNQLPIGVQVANPTGFTASGKPYLTVPVDELPRNLPVLRIHVGLSNPSLIAPSTFNIGPSTEVFAGPFDPTQF
jgi:hypothetical protein